MKCFKCKGKKFKEEKQQFRKAMIGKICAKAMVCQKCGMAIMNDAQMNELIRHMYEQWCVKGVVWL
jgi:hypothetical protein